jgi:hypothetical protein
VSSKSRWPIVEIDGGKAYAHVTTHGLFDPPRLGYNGCMAVFQGDCTIAPGRDQDTHKALTKNPIRPAAKAAGWTRAHRLPSPAQIRRAAGSVHRPQCPRPVPHRMSATCGWRGRARETQPATGELTGAPRRGFGKARVAEGSGNTGPGADEGDSAANAAAARSRAGRAIPTQTR